METARLTPSGTLLSDGFSEVADPMLLLGDRLELQPGCTLRSFFRMLSEYPVLVRLSRFLPAALEEAAACPPTGCLTDEAPALVLGRTMELIGFPGEPRAELYVWLRGLEFPEREGGAANSGNGLPPLAVLMEANKDTRFIPLRMLLDTPLFLGGLMHVVLGDVDRRLVCESRFTLFEVVDGLAWELGFHGGSQQCSIGR